MAKSLLYSKRSPFLSSINFAIFSFRFFLLAGQYRRPLNLATLVPSTLLSLSSLIRTHPSRSTVEWRCGVVYVMFVNVYVMLARKASFPAFVGYKHYSADLFRVSAYLP